MVNLFLIEDTTRNHRDLLNLCEHLREPARLFYHSGQGDVIDFIQRNRRYSLLPEPDLFLIDYHLKETHHAALAAIIHATYDHNPCPVILLSSTLPDPDLEHPERRDNALKQLGFIDDFIHTPFTLRTFTSALKRAHAATGTFPPCLRHKNFTQSSRKSA